MHKIIKLTLLAFLLAACFSSAGLAQGKKTPELGKREATRRRMHSRDSLLRSFNRSDTSINSLLQRIEQYTTSFNQIRNNLAEGLDTADISAGFPPVFRRINKIDSLTNTHKSSTLRYLFVLRDNLDHLQGKLEDWQADLEDVSTKLVQNQRELLKFFKDTTLRAVPGDSSIREAFFERRRAIMHLFRETDSVNRGNLLKVNLLQDKIAVAYTKILDESDHIDSKIKKFATKAINGESDFIWNTGPQYDDFKQGLNGTIKLNKILFNYFIKNETYTHYIGILFFVLFLGWVIFVRVKTLRHNDDPDTVFTQAPYIRKHPVVVSLLTAAAIIPYFYDHPPVVFLETLFLISMIVSLRMIHKYYHKCCFNFFHRLFWVAFVYAVSNLFIQITNIDRYVIALLSIISIVFAWLYLQKAKHEAGEHFPYTLTVLKVFIAMQGLSLLLNISGRFSLAKIIGVTAVFNFWFLVILFFVIQTVIQGLFLQFQAKKGGNSILNWIDYNIVQKKFRSVLVTVAGLLWLFFLFQNLNIDDWASDNVTEILNQPRTVVGASFTFGGFVIFIVVIWLSSLLSRVVSYFYEVSAQRVTDLSIAKRKNRTSTLLIRIGVFSLGFLLAVAASGFPLEKLTIIISAFGIGIGFGLQNIVNNLVSGIILAFEKPIQIGDIIEVDKRSGTMKEIGIRSSKILTGDGSEVIIPNGDLISQHVVNWTLSNSNRRIELTITTAYGCDIEKVKELLMSVLTNREDIMASPAPSVFLNNFSQVAVEFKAFFWADDINTVTALKSRVLADINQMFVKEGIDIPSGRNDVFVHFPDGPVPLPPAKTEAETEENKKTGEGGANKNAPDQAR